MLTGVGATLLMQRYQAVGHRDTGFEGSTPVLDVYYGTVPTDRSVLRALSAVLDADDQRSIARYRQERDRAVRSFARASLRIVLGQRLGIRAESVRIHREVRGKPFIQGGPAFNLSHSADRILIGVASGGKVGVDLELVRPLNDLSGLARSVFSAAEMESLMDCPAGVRLRGFYRGWTRKEAYVKGLGTGLGAALDQFTVCIDAECEDALLSARAEDGVSWRVQPVQVADDCEAAVAWDRKIDRIVTHDLRDEVMQALQ
jgi:4'-phosphopantetheinyl transferase